MTTATANQVPAEGMKSKISDKPELTWEDKSKQLKGYIKAAEDYNLWRRMAQECAMTQLAPRAYHLGYDMQKSVGTLITNLAHSYHPSMSYYAKCEKDWTDMMLNEVLFDLLCEDIIDAEQKLAAR